MSIANFSIFCSCFQIFSSQNVYQYVRDSNGTQMWDANPATGAQFPASTEQRSRDDDLDQVNHLALVAFYWILAIRY